MDVEVAHCSTSELTTLTVEGLQFVMDLADVLPQIHRPHEGLFTSVTLVLLPGVVSHPVEILSHHVSLHLGLFSVRVLGPRLVLNNLLE